MIQPVTIREIMADLSEDDLASASERSAAIDALEAEDRASSPWYVRLMASGAAWVAALLLMGFLELMDLVEFDEQGLELGAAFIIAATAARWIFSVASTSERTVALRDFIEQTTLALSVVGRALIFIGVVDRIGYLDDADALRGAGATLLMVELFLLALYRDDVQRFLSAALAGLWSGLIVHDQPIAYSREMVTLAFVAAAGAAWIFRARLMRGPLAPWLVPVGFGLVIAAGGLILEGGVIARLLDGRPPLGPVAGVGVTLLLALVAWRVLGQLDLRPAAPPALVIWATLAVIAAIAWRQPGIPFAIGILTVAFHARDRLLLILGVAFLLFFGGHWYYQMELDLMAKSGVLAGSGLALLAGRWALLQVTDGHPITRKVTT